MVPRDSATAVVALVVALVAAAKVALASRLGLMADEALYRMWAQRLDLGYFDQPPGIAWLLAATAWLGDGPVATRAVPIALGAVVVVALRAAAGDAVRWAVWAAGLPVLFGLTFAATPDAGLLAGWAGALAGAIAGGPTGWVLAGLCGGGATLCKYTGAAVVPLAMLAVPDDRKTPWPWVGLALAVGLWTPNLVWNALHDGVTLRFQAGEGWFHPQAPGLVGLVLQPLGQLAVATPLAGLAGFGAAAVGWRATSRAQRIAWWTSAPVVAFFWLSAPFGPPEAHWPAPAWLGLGVWLSWDAGWLGRLAAVGGWLGALATAGLAGQLVQPWLGLSDDPADRFAAGPVLGAWVRDWAIPAAAEGTQPAQLVWTERYQEAAWIDAYAGPVRAHVFPGCGRPNQFDLWPAPEAGETALFVRPSTSGPLVCLPPPWRVIGGPHRLQGRDAHGRPVGDWQLFEVAR